MPSSGGIFGKVYKGGRFVMEQAPVENGIWLPVELSYNFKGRKFVFGFELHEQTRASGYRRIGPPAQALARAKQRHRLEQVGLARAVLADEHHRTLVETHARAAIVAEIGELQLLDIEPRHWAKGLAHGLVNGPFAMSAQSRSHTRIGMST